MKKLKVLQLVINPDTDDNTGVDCISLVDSPAIEKDFIAFSKESVKLKFAVTNADKQIVSGPIMIPDTYIYRNQRDELGAVISEWYVYATKETISQVIEKFFKLQRNANASLEHNGQLQNGVYLIESFQVDSDRGIAAPTGYGNIPNGSWFGSMKVDNPEVWAAIKAGTFNGFSIEGLFSYDDTNTTVSQPDKPAGVISKYSGMDFMELKRVLHSESEYNKLNSLLTNF
jgi:hypothetical protein